MKWVKFNDSFRPKTATFKSSTFLQNVSENNLPKNVQKREDTENLHYGNFLIQAVHSHSEDDLPNNVIYVKICIGNIFRS